MSAPGGQGHREEDAEVLANAMVDTFDGDEVVAEWAQAVRELGAEVERLREREAHFAKVLGVADGGQYRNDWDGAIRRVLDERGRLRSALEEITKWAEAARGHYGIEECSGPGRPRTEWDEIQDGLRAAALFAREALSGPAPNEDRG